MRLTKIYTKLGDDGSTGIVGGQKIPKDSERIEAYGTIDELNAFLGLLRDRILEMGLDSFWTNIVDRLLVIQNEMHDLGGELATPAVLLDARRQQLVSNESIRRLETEIDDMNLQLDPLANFILPGGHVLSSLSHVCRTICRRAERRLVTLSHTETVRSEPRIYLNRLSDWLFVMGRLVSRKLGVKEILWQQNSGRGAQIQNAD